MLILVQLRIISRVENLENFSWRLQSEQVLNVRSTCLKKKFDVRFVEDSFLAEVGLADCAPHFFALARGAKHGFGLADELVALVLGDVCEGIEGFGDVLVGSGRAAHGVDNCSGACLLKQV